MILDKIFGIENRDMVVSDISPGSDYWKDPTFQKKFWGASGMTGAGLNITLDTAETLSAVYCANRLISSTVGSLPRAVYKREGKEGDKKSAREHAVYHLLHERPNPIMSPIHYGEIGMSYTLMWGRSLSYIETDNGGKAIGLWPIHTGDVVRGWQDNSPIYDISRCRDTDLFPQPPTTKRILLSHEVIDVPTHDGKSIISHAREQLGEAVAAQNFSAGFYAGGAQPMLALIDKSGGLDKTGSENLRRQWREKHGGAVRNIAVLESDFDIKTVGMPLDDAQFLESRQFYVAEIARWFGVPPHKLYDLSRATFSNIGEQKLEFYEVLIWWLVRWEQELQYKLFKEYERAEYIVQHIVENLLKGDIEKRYNAYSQGLQWGYLNRNEVRRKENLNDMGEDGDTYMVPNNMMPASASQAAEGGGVGGKPLEGNAKPVNAAEPDNQAPTDQNVKVAEDAVLSGSQITAATAIVTAVATGELPRDAGIGQLVVLFNLTKEQAEQIMGSAGNGFEPKEEQPKKKPEPEGAIPAAARTAVKSAIARMIHKESAEIRKAAREPKKFLDWLDKFYSSDGWEAKMLKGVDPAADACRALGIAVIAEPAIEGHCRRSKDSLLELSGKLTPTGFAAGIEKELGGWADSLPDLLTSHLFGDKDNG